MSRNAGFDRDVPKGFRRRKAVASTNDELLTAGAVRRHCADVAGEAIAGRSAHFCWHEARLLEVAAYVVDVIRHRYPDLRVPFHSRWRHFDAACINRWGWLCAHHGLDNDSAALERARVAVDLVIPSVLLGAGAGPNWRFHEQELGVELTRSEGLAVASFRFFASGQLSDDPVSPLRSDASALARLRLKDVAAAFQAGPHNPLVGVESRAALLTRLGERMQAQPRWFGAPARLGNLVDFWRTEARDGGITASEVLHTLLQVTGDIWPARVMVDGSPLGDCWPHPAASGGLVPFHKLTQWLTYSLLEPLADAGIEVTGLDALTGLSEYRNGGLLLDLGLIEAKDTSFHTRTLTVDEPAVVEWRALTVVGLDRLAPLVRTALGVSEAAFPLVRMLEGGTWAAGRKIARARRAGGGPPVRIASDGTVF